ncbi:MAG: hypothetical protein GC129_05710 [Proteobacteria bacterium]|nr:hypothetical protein [Pseudomonadota bacterium]
MSIDVGEVPPPKLNEPRSPVLHLKTELFQLGPPSEAEIDRQPRPNYGGSLSRLVDPALEYLEPRPALRYGVGLTVGMAVTWFLISPFCRIVLEIYRLSNSTAS